MRGDIHLQEEHSAGPEARSLCAIFSEPGPYDNFPLSSTGFVGRETD